MQQLVAVRDDERRTEARRDLSLLQALRQAIPASLDDSTETKKAYEKFEAGLVAKTNDGPPPPPKRRYAPSKRQRK